MNDDIGLLVSGGFIQVVLVNAPHRRLLEAIELVVGSCTFGVLACQRTPRSPEEGMLEAGHTGGPLLRIPRNHRTYQV